MNKLLNYLQSTGAVTYGDFVGKSGVKYSVETDLRCAFSTYKKAYITAEKIIEEIDKLPVERVPFLGVPETGSLMAFFLNAVRLKNDENVSINMLRAQPKLYQSASNSVYTVLPATDTPYILIEDDVVTGQTICKYLENAIEAHLKIVAVISVFGRANAKLIKQKCEQIQVPYYELIKF